MLETERLKLVAFEKDDTPLFSEWENSPAVQKFFFANPYALPQPEKDAELFDHWLEEMAKSKCAIYKVVLKLDASKRRAKERPIGLCGWHETGNIPGRYELWLYIGEENLLSRGLGTEIIKVLTRSLFENYAAHTVMLCFYSYNERGRKCYLEKCGFTPEGRRREAILWQGEFYDMEYASVTLEEFQALKAKGVY
jgi:RimJ/RimL family protein N-acetyltransferase